MKKSSICVILAFILLFSGLFVLIYQPFEPKVEWPRHSDGSINWGSTIEAPETIISSEKVVYIVFGVGIFISISGAVFALEETRTSFRSRISKFLNDDDVERVMREYG